MAADLLFHRNVTVRKLHTVDLVLRLRVVADNKIPVEQVIRQQDFSITSKKADGYVVDAVLSAIRPVTTESVVLESAATGNDTLKRRGRPRKLPSAASAPVAAPKRRGRPPKKAVAAAVGTVKAKRPGRPPKKTVAAVAAVAKGKRRGRPKGSKNKRKSVAKK